MAGRRMVRTTTPDKAQVCMSRPYSGNTANLNGPIRASDFWGTNAKSVMLAPTLAAMTSGDAEEADARASAGKFPGTHHLCCSRACGEGASAEVVESASGHCLAYQSAF